ncbi:MAG: DUF924 domain-containing protein [Candidatus Dadabacteria bacterium]|nr:DUF924 domain-containing protein [Candidatus Dadabacteria bacterium]
MKKEVLATDGTEAISEVLGFWFGDLREGELPDKEKQMTWWMKSEEFDDLVRQRFEKYVLLAEKEELSHWLETPLGTVAFIIVVDQFPRNIYRDTPEAFSRDLLALRVCLEGIEKGFDRDLHPTHRTFFYLPLMHSEDLEIQGLSVEKYSALENEYTSHPQIRETLAYSTDFAGRHFDIIKRFGRYPHRNAALGRESTPEETEFLKEPGSSF